MNNQQLVSFIQEQLKNGFSKDQIKNHLVQNSWQENQVQEAFVYIENLTQNTNSITGTQIQNVGNNNINTDQNKSEPVSVNVYEYAGFWLRFLAMIIDTTILNIVLVVVLAGLRFVLSDEILNTVSIVVSIILALVYFTVLESKRGATFGKSIVGLRVLDLNNQNISWLRALGRYVAKIPSFLLLTIGFLMAAFTEKKQGLHDIISGCVVVKVEQKKIWLIVLGIIGVNVIVALLLAYYAYSMISGFINMFLGQENSQNVTSKNSVEQVQDKSNKENSPGMEEVYVLDGVSIFDYYKKMYGSQTRVSYEVDKSCTKKVYEIRDVEHKKLTRDKEGNISFFTRNLQINDGDIFEVWGEYVNFIVTESSDLGGSGIVVKLSEATISDTCLSSLKM